MGNSQGSWTTASIGDSIKGKNVIVTGASSGLGLETARVLAAHGANVTMAVRNPSKTTPLVEAIKAQQPSASIDLQVLDLEDLDSVKAFAAAYLASHNTLDVLINNAGIMTPAKHHRTKQGFDCQMGTNHYGHFVLTSELLALLIKTQGSRVVNVSSIMHKHPKTAASFKQNFDSEHSYEPWPGYGRSKLANVLFSFQLKDRLRAAGHQFPLVLVAHPGYTATNLQFADKSAASRALFSTLNFLASQPVEKGALPQIRAAVDPEAKDGEFYGPSGFQEMTGAAVVVQAQPLAHDKELQQWLWDLSKSKTGVDIDAKIQSSR